MTRKRRAGLLALAVLLVAPMTREIVSPPRVGAAAVPVSGTALSGQVVVEWRRTAGSVASGSWFAEARGLAPGLLEAAAADGRRVFPVYAEAEDSPNLDPSLPPMAGAYTVAEGVLRFVPAFPPSPGMRYRAVLRKEGLPPGAVPEGSRSTAVHEEPAVAAAPTTVVTRVAPSSSVVPENLLKFYVHFSAPMSRGHIYEHIHLRDSEGANVELPFLEIDEELWNPDLTRLTLFLDPGRIKRGVRPLEEVGPSLQAGRGYTLVIDRAWRDAAGQPLKASFEKKFEVGPADREPPDLGRWTVRAPRAGGREALAVQFGEPMDDALARRLLVVEGDGVAAPTGRAELAGDERQWLFVPDSPWPAGRYRLTVGGALEDLAGNNPGKPFEVDLFENVQKRITNAVFRLSFEIQ